MALRQSNATDEAGQRHFQGCSDPDQRINGDILLSTLHVADVGRIQVRFLRELLLAHPGLFVRDPDILAENAPMFGEKITQIRKQESNRATIGYTRKPVFASAWKTDYNRPQDYPEATGNGF
jgi:hypothetical protein